MEPRRAGYSNECLDLEANAVCSWSTKPRAESEAKCDSLGTLYKFRFDSNRRAGRRRRWFLQKACRSLLGSRPPIPVTTPKPPHTVTPAPTASSPPFHAKSGPRGTPAWASTYLPDAVQRRRGRHRGIHYPDSQMQFLTRIARLGH